MKVTRVQDLYIYTPIPDPQQMTKRTKEEALAELLVDLFPTESQLQLFVLSLPNSKTQKPSIDFTGSSSKLNLAFDVVDYIRSRGLIDADFFERLGGGPVGGNYNFSNCRRRYHDLTGFSRPYFIGVFLEC